MNRLIVTKLCAIALLAMSFSSGAAKLYKWVDDNSNVVYQDTPPPDDVRYEEQQLPDDEQDGAMAAEIEAAVVSSPVVLYRTGDCDACELVRLALERRGVPFEERDAGGDLAAQKDLIERSGRLEVPTVTIGDQVLTGYSRSALDQALSTAGYPARMAKPEATEGEAPAELEATEEEAPEEREPTAGEMPVEAPMQ